MKRYGGISKLRNTNDNLRKLGTPYYSPTIYPEIPLSENDIYVITDFGDRLDLLADQFYKDTTLYWVIASANPNVVNFGSLSLQEGTQLRIPSDINGILRSYNILNNI
jgi:hypothetical protein